MDTQSHILDIKDKKLIRGVQHRATKMIPELNDKDYIDRLKALKLPSMHYRSDRGDVIETPFTIEDDTTHRGHSLKIKKLEQKRRYASTSLETEL